MAKSPELTFVGVPRKPADENGWLEVVARVDTAAGTLIAVGRFSREQMRSLGHSLVFAAAEPNGRAN